MSDSEEDPSPEKVVFKHRLGNCEVCIAVEAKYTCPKCEVKTCSLNCNTIHKKELECDGVRDKTKYIPRNKMTAMDFESDYRFLEECTRFVTTRQTDPIKQLTRTDGGLPQQLIKLRTEANARKTTLKFLFANFTKRKQNTTRFDSGQKKIFWHIQWVLVHNEGATINDDNIDENDEVGEIFEKHFKKRNEKTLINLDYYKSRPFSDHLFLLKAEGIPNCSNRFYELDINSTLKEALRNKILVEFPVIYVTFADCRSQFEIIPESEEVGLVGALRQQDNKLPKIKQEPKEEPESKNFLFTNEHFWSSSDDEEEVKLKVPKLE